MDSTLTDYSSIIIPILAAGLTSLFSVLSKVPFTRVDFLARVRVLKQLRMGSSSVRQVFERLSDLNIGRLWWVVALVAAWAWGIPAALLTHVVDPDVSDFSVLAGLAFTAVILQLTMFAVTDYAVRAIRGETEEGRNSDRSRIASLYALPWGIGLGWFVALFLFLIMEFPALVSSASGPGWVGVAIIFAILGYVSILLGLETLQSRSRIENATFQALTPTASMPKVKVTLLLVGGRVSNETEAHIRGIGQVCIVRREDGFWESIRWKDFVRVAILQPEET
jgi:hypothetical protein